MKRAHRKVRTGCDACRLRRIKCDELRPVCTPCRRLAANHADRESRCSFAAADQAKGSTGLHNMPIEQSTSVTTILSPNDPSTSLAASNYGWPEQLSSTEKRLLNHSCTIHGDLNAIIQSGHVTGLTQFAKYLVMARSCNHVRYAVCTVAAAHIRTLTHSTEIGRVEVENRMLAMRGMGLELQTKSHGRFDHFDNYLEELIASSTLLVWNAPCGNEFASLLKGITALKAELLALKENPKPAPDENYSGTYSNSQQHRMISNESGQIDDDVLLDALNRSARCLSKCSLDDELKAAVRELQCFIHNIGRLVRCQHSSEDQLFASWPIRNWLRLVPQAHVRLAAGDPLALLYLANYELALLAACKLLPQLRAGLSVDDRAASVMRMRGVIDNALGLEPTRHGELEMREKQKRLLARQAWDQGWDVCSKSLAEGLKEVQ